MLSLQRPNERLLTNQQEIQQCENLAPAVPSVSYFYFFLPGKTCQSIISWAFKLLLMPKILSRPDGL